MQGKVESHTKAKNAFRIEQTWYNLGPGVQLPDRFDIIAFEPQQGGDARMYMNQQHQIIEKGQAPNFGTGGGGGGNKGGSGGGNNGKYDNLGQQVGNAITNATRLLAGGVIKAPEGELVQTMVALAKQIMKAGDDTRAYHEAKPAAPAQRPVAQQAPVNTVMDQAGQRADGPGGVQGFDDDIPF